MKYTVKFDEPYYYDDYVAQSFEKAKDFALHMKEHYNVDSRIMIDFEMWNTRTPDFNPVQTFDVKYHDLQKLRDNIE